MVVALVLVAFVAGSVGAAFGGAIPGWGVRLGGLWRWWRHGRGGRPLRELARATPGGDVVVEGRLHVSGETGHVVLATAVPPATDLDLPGSAAVSAAARDVWIETDDGKVLIAAEVIVTCGSVEIAPGCPAAPVGRALGELPADLCSIARWPVRCLLPGDRVRATGRLESAPDLDGPTDYRSRAARYRMFALPPESGVAEGIRVASTRPPRPFVLGRTRVIAAGAGAVFFASVAVAALGMAAREEEEAAEAHATVPWVAPTRSIDEALAEHRYEDAASLADAFGAGAAEQAARAHFMSGDLRAAAAAYATLRDRSPSLSPSWNELDSYLAAHEYTKSAHVAGLLASGKGEVGEGLTCQANVLRMITDLGEPRRVPILKASYPFTMLCTLAFADITRDQRTSIDLSNMLNARLFGMMRPGPPPPPTDLELDSRVAAHLMAERGELGDWPFEPPFAAHLLTANGAIFRMPITILETSTVLRRPSLDWQERMERSVMAAAWGSFLGDHERAARDYRAAMLAAGLDDAAPLESGSRGRYFEAPRIHSLLGKKSGREPSWSAHLYGIGAALALRAGELEHANAYVDLFTEDEDRSRIRRFLWAARAEKPGPMLQISGMLGESVGPKERAFLQAADTDAPALPDLLVNMDAQGLWPIIGRHLRTAREPVRRWAAGDGPSICGDCGYHGLLSHWAARRAAAQAIEAPTEEARAAQRIGRLSTLLFDRRAIVLLHVSGRLAALSREERPSDP